MPINSSPEKTPMPRKASPETFPDTPEFDVPENEWHPQQDPLGQPPEREAPLHEGAHDKPHVNPEDDVPPKN